jgi:hypothetical protein
LARLRATWHRRPEYPSAATLPLPPLLKPLYEVDAVRSTLIQLVQTSKAHTYPIIACVARISHGQLHLARAKSIIIRGATAGLHAGPYAGLPAVPGLKQSSNTADQEHWPGTRPHRLFPHKHNSFGFTPFNGNRTALFGPRRQVPACFSLSPGDNPLVLIRRHSSNHSENHMQLRRG